MFALKKEEYELRRSRKGMPKNGVQSGLRPLCTPFFGANPLLLRNTYESHLVTEVAVFNPGSP
jgi:hypothetical protein